MSTRRISMTLMPLEMLASLSSFISSVLLRDGGAVGRAVGVARGGLRLRIVSSAILDFACLDLLGGEGEG